MSDLDHQHHSQIAIAANVLVKLLVLSFRGQKIKGHAHTFDHITLVASGTVAMRANGKEILIEGPELVITPAGVVHEFECMGEGALLCCTHAIRDGDGEDDIAPQDITEEQAIELVNTYPLTKG